jgi:predicted nucleic acid-binding Zn ribbon protein
MSFLLEVLAYLRARKKFFLVPVMLIMVLLGGLIVLSHGSALAPFIYTLF